MIIKRKKVYIDDAIGIFKVGSVLEMTNKEVLAQFIYERT